MTALAKDRNTREAIGDVEEFPVLANVVCFAGGIAVLDADGWAKPGVTATGLISAGRFEARADNTGGANGAIRARVKRGVFHFFNSAAADEITKAEIGDNCYVVDDQTVAKTSGGATRSIAGRIEQVDAQGVWVRMGSALLAAPGGALLAANNFSDVGSAATARNNLGVNVGLGTPSFVIGAEAGNVINVAIQLKDLAGADLAVRAAVDAYFSDDANGDSVIATAPSGAVAIGTDGVLFDQVAKKAFRLVSENDGDIDINITEAGAKTMYLILIMPNGRLVASAAITFA